MTCDANIDIAFSDERWYVSSREENKSNWMIHNKANIESVVSPKLDIRTRQQFDAFFVKSAFLWDCKQHAAIDCFGVHIAHRRCSEQNWSVVEKNKMAAIMDELVKVGAEDILIFKLDNCRV